MKTGNQQLKKTWNSIQYDINRKSSNANFRSTISVPKKNESLKYYRTVSTTAINK